MEDNVLWLDRMAGAQNLGTRFLVFPQPPFVPGYDRPELVWISTPLGAVGPGPCDRRLYTVDPLLQKSPYHYPHLPPYTGDRRPPVLPGPDGHFDHLEVGTRAFLAAHVFACVRRVLDIFEGYLGREIDWFFAETYERLEIVPHLQWDNAQSGFGFLEMGQDDSRGEPFPFGLNFDAVAHETGHLILFGVLGLPDRGEPDVDLLSYHEAIGDTVSLLGLLHFDTALDRILRRTRGNLLVANELDHLAELSDEQSVRVASHSLKMSDVGFQVHDRSKPFTAAIFDTLVEIHHLLLLERGMAFLDSRTFSELRLDLTTEEIEQELALTQRDYELRHFAVKAALIEARDMVGETLARSWDFLDCNAMTLQDAAHAFRRAAETGRMQAFADRAYENFLWRELL